MIFGINKQQAGHTGHTQDTHSTHTPHTLHTHTTHTHLEQAGGAVYRFGPCFV